MKKTKDITDEFSKRALLSKKESKEYFQLFLEIICEYILSEGLDISGFGKFIIKVTPERRCRHPVTKEIIIIPEGRKILFKASEKLKDKL